MVRQVRHIIDGPLPDGPLPDGEVILAPTRQYRKIVLWPVTALALTAATVKSFPAVTSILLSGRSVRVKRDQVLAEIWLASVAEMFSKKRLRQMGFHRAICECSPGMGHRANPA